MGKVRGNDGGWVPSTSHEALVSQGLFDRVQEKLGRRRTSIHYDKKLGLPFRGFLRCSCGRVFTPHEQKGLVYFGARCDRSCANPRRSLNLAAAHHAVEGVLRGLPFTEEEIARIDAAIGKGGSLTDERKEAERETDERRAKKLREDLAYLADNRLTLLRTGAYTPEALAADEVRLSTELEKLEAPPVASDEEKRQVTSEIVQISELLKTLHRSHELAKPEEKEPLARIVLSELSVFENTLSYKCANGFRAFERALFSEGALSSWLSEGVTRSDEMAQAKAALETLLSGLSERP